MVVGVYPGSFNPPTVAHLAIARAAMRQCGLDRLDLVLSRHALGKDAVGLVTVEDRLVVLCAVAAGRTWTGAGITERRFIADIAETYDVVVVGADKWSQITDPAWYGDDPGARDAMVARLPTIAYAPRHGHPPPLDLPAGSVVLDVDEVHHPVSASEVRAGRLDWMAPEARVFAERTGAWVDPGRYALARGSKPVV